MTTIQRQLRRMTTHLPLLLATENPPADTWHLSPFHCSTHDGTIDRNLTAKALVLNRGAHAALLLLQFRGWTLTRPGTLDWASLAMISTQSQNLSPRT
jgi:hypothetical protein